MEENPGRRQNNCLTTISGGRNGGDDLEIKKRELSD